MSRNGHEMDDEKRDPSIGESDDSPLGAASESRSAPPPKPRARKSRVPKAPARTSTTTRAAAKADAPASAPAKKTPARKSVAPRSRRSIPPKAPRSAGADLAATLVTPPHKHPALAHGSVTVVDPDSISIPPADLDEHDELFFAEGEAVSQRAHELDAPSRRKPVGFYAAEVAERPLSPVVPHEHRKKLANYVKIAVAISSTLCLLALVRVGMGRVDHGGERSAAAAPVVTHAMLAPTPEVKPVVAPPPKAVEAVAPAVPLKSAKEEREDARASLEHGKAKDAIEAATRSVTIDPTDAEAWLLLGAAQQEAGHPGDAHASFLECTKQAKLGNVGECKAMLQWNGPR